MLWALRSVEALDPDNAFWPAMLAATQFAALHDEEGLAALRRADQPGPYQLQAAIAALHLAPPGDTDWAAVAHLYDRLRRLRPSAVVAVAHAAAVGYADGPAAGIALLRPLLAEPALRRYQPLHATLADLLRRTGDSTGAALAYRRAIELTGNGVERGELLRRLAELPAQ